MRMMGLLFGFGLLSGFLSEPLQLQFVKKPSPTRQLPQSEEPYSLKIFHLKSVSPQMIFTKVKQANAVQVCVVHIYRDK